LTSCPSPRSLVTDKIDEDVEDIMDTRSFWQLTEPLHAQLYYAPEAFEEAAALGHDVSTRWPSYFAWRAAPLGAAGARLVGATFYSFSPRMIAEYVPAVWDVAGPADVLAARGRAVARFWRSTEGIGEAAALARTAVEAADLGGRPLAAANADLPWPTEPGPALWHALTILREHRGDGHVMALRTLGLDPCEALVSLAALRTVPERVFESRGWTAGEWGAARERLAARGWVDADGTATDRGREGRAEVERITDELAAAPWRALGPDLGRFAALVGPMTMAVVGTGLLPTQSTLAIVPANR
jgi:hypothetical protein